jgi:hypothetical protein
MTQLTQCSAVLKRDELILHRLLKTLPGLADTRQKSDNRYFNGSPWLLSPTRVNLTVAQASQSNKQHTSQATQCQ